MSEAAGPAKPTFEHLAAISESATARVELCRIAGGELAGVLVAVKRPRFDAAVAAQLVEMFRDETRMTSSLTDEHIVRLLCWGTDDQGPYFATEFVRGVSASRLLRTVVSTGDSFPERIVASLVLRICRGLAAAHGLCAPSGEALHLVHRDLTPDNVLLGFDGEVKISDFGMAKTKHCGPETLAGMVRGTTAYMAPEQIRGEALDGRADIFAIGVLMFELLTGRRPWRGMTPADTMKRIVEEPLPSPGGLRAGLNEELVALVERCLAKDRSDRVAGARDLEAALSKWLVACGQEDSQEHLARFVRRHGRRQMRWCDRAIAGEFVGGGEDELLVPRAVGDEPARGLADTLRDPQAELGCDPSTLDQREDLAEVLAPSVTEPDLLLVGDETLDTGVTMPSVAAKLGAAGKQSKAARPVRKRPVFVALPHSTPPPGPPTQADPLPSPPTAASVETPPPPAEATPPAGDHRSAAVYRDAKEILAAASDLGVRSDRAAREALDAAQRARMAGEAARIAAERAEYGGRAAILAERAIAAIEAGALGAGEDLLDRAKELRRESDAERRE